MNTERESKETEETEDPSPEPEVVSGDGEFKFTVRKLEMPVRPRGVLAE